MNKERQAFEDMMDGLTKIVEACAGHKAALVNAGFSEEIAEMMTVQFHARMMIS